MTSSFNLAGATVLNHKALIIDLDVQGILTKAVGVDERAVVHSSSFLLPDKHEQQPLTIRGIFFNRVEPRTINSIDVMNRADGAFRDDFRAANTCVPKLTDITSCFREGGPVSHTKTESRAVEIYTQLFKELFNAD